MTRTPEVAENEFVMVGPSGRTQLITESNDLKDLQALALRMADKCQRLLPANADEDMEAERCSDHVEQSTQTEIENTSNDKLVELSNLKTKLKEVVDMNVGWQLVYGHQEKVIADLKQQLQAVQPLATTQSLHPHESFTEKQYKYAEQPNPRSNDVINCEELDSWKMKCVQLEHDKSELEETVRSLTAQVDSMQELMRQLECAVDLQQGRLDAAVQEKQSFIDTLQAQIMVYREDFQCERQDRERAQGKIIELKNELEQLKSRLAEQSLIRQSTRALAPAAFSQQPIVSHAYPYNAYHRQHYDARFPPTTATANAYSFAEVRQVPRQGEFYPRVGRDEVDCTTDGVDDVKDTLTSDSNRHNVSFDGVMTPDGSESKVDQSTVPENDVSGELRCPCCRKSYTLDQHIELMDHMDACLAG